MTKQSTKQPAKQRVDSEASFLESYDASGFERPSVTVDVVLMTTEGETLQTLLIERPEHPCRGCWALPGGFVGPEESLEKAAARVLEEKTGLRDIFLEQLYSFGQPDRDPRTRVITVAYYALVAGPRLAGRRLANIVVPWAGETGGPVEAVDAEGEPLGLAFDHAEILGMAVRRLRGKINYSSIGFQLVPDKFTLRQLQTVHETILAGTLNKDSFRRRQLASGVLEATGEKESEVGYRPAELYRFVRRAAV